MTITDIDWTRHAACAGQNPDLFFRDEHDHTTYQEARRFCCTCRVQLECLNWAIETKTEHGIFGGLTPRERKRLR